MRQVDNSQMMNMYEKMGISKEVLEFSNKILDDLKERFDRIDDVSEYNQMKVLHAMQKNKLSDIHFAATTGYGYNDLGRETIEKIFAEVLGAEEALVRNQFISGSHALNVCFFAYSNKDG